MTAFDHIGLALAVAVLLGVLAWPLICWVVDRRRFRSVVEATQKACDELGMDGVVYVAVEGNVKAGDPVYINHRTGKVSNVPPYSQHRQASKAHLS